MIIFFFVFLRSRFIVLDMINIQYHKILIDFDLLYREMSFFFFSFFIFMLIFKIKIIFGNIIKYGK